MTKKLIALVEVLMVISLLCTGYASWAVTVGESFTPTWQEDGPDFKVYDTAKYTLTDFGIAFSDDVQGESFRYSTISTSGSTTYKLTNTTLSVALEVTDSVMKTWLEGTNTDYRVAAVEIKCTDAGNKHFSGSATSCREIGLIPPSYAKLVVDGYPNLSIAVAVTLGSDGSMSVRIPVEQIYNLAKLDKINTTATVLHLQYEFTDSIAASNNAFINSVVKYVKPSYTAYAAAN